jgi:hypothetical protein
VTPGSQDGHEQIEELLAGYVLRSLSGEDAAEADRLLSDHVPSCSSCRDTLATFQTLTADLALDTAPVDPPETLLPRLHRELEPQARRRRPLQVVAVAASVVVVAGLAGLAVTQGVRANHSQRRADQLSNIMTFASQPNAKQVPVGPAIEVSEPGTEVFYLYGTTVPSPAPGTVYRVYLVSGSTPTYIGEFLPDNGYVYLQVPFDPNVYDQLWVTAEVAGTPPATPTAGDALWQTAS